VIVAGNIKSRTSELAGAFFCLRLREIKSKRKPTESMETKTKLVIGIVGFGTTQKLQNTPAKLSG
jgi:hypothetical protein